MIQKVFKVDEHLVVSLPIEAELQLGMRPGTEVEVKIDEKTGIILIRPVSQNRPADITPEFSQLLDEL